MFTLEESAHLGFLLRLLAGAAVVALLAAGSCVGLHEYRRHHQAAYTLR